MTFDVQQLPFEEIELFGKPMLFTNLRVNRATIPEGLYAYDIRHDDEGWGDPVEIASCIMVNHWGTVITDDRILGDDEKWRDIDPEKDWAYTGRYVRNFSQILRYFKKN